MKRGLIFLIIILVIILGCTKKKNPTGFNPSFELKTKIIDWKYFDRAYSYEDSIRNSDFTNLILGNFNNISADILMKFTAFPDSVFEVENAKIKMTINKKYNFDNVSADDIKLGYLNTNWKESSVTWFTTGDSLNWKNSTEFSEEDFTPIDYLNFEVLDDTVSFEFDNNIVKNWINTDSLNCGIVLYTQKDSAFIVFNSSEIGSDEIEPTLSFDYKITADDTLMHYQKNSYYDTFIYHKIDNGDLQYFNNKIFLSGIMPTASYIHFNLPDSLFFSESNNEIDNHYESKRITVLRAELLLYPKEEQNYPLNSDFTIKPYLVISDSANSQNPNTPLEYRTDYISYGKVSDDSLYVEEFKIDVTSVVQSIIAGTYVNSEEEFECNNYGMLLKTLKENVSFANIEFYSIVAQEVEKRPKLVIKYITPKFDY